MSNDGSGQVGTSWTGLGLIIAVIGVLGLAELAAQLPASARKIVLFSVAFGVMSGFIVSWTAADQRISKAVAVPLTGLLVVVGLALIGFRSFDQLRSARMAALKGASGKGFEKMILNQLVESDPELVQPSFGDYLALRVRPLGQWRQPWPAVFWGGEIALAAAGGALVAHRRLRPNRDDITETA